MKMHSIRTVAFALVLMAGVSGLAVKAANATDIVVTTGLGNVEQQQVGPTTQKAVSLAIAVGHNAGSTNSSSGINLMNQADVTDAVAPVLATVTTDTGSFNQAANFSATDNGASAESGAVQGAESASGAFAANGSGAHPDAIAANAAEAADFAANGSESANWQKSLSGGESSSGTFSSQDTAVITTAEAGVTQNLTNVVDQNAFSAAGSAGLSGGAINTSTALNGGNLANVSVTIHP